VVGLFHGKKENDLLSFWTSKQNILKLSHSQIVREKINWRSLLSTNKRRIKYETNVRQYFQKDEGMALTFDPIFIFWCL
jgi:hypothetical protein